MSAAAVRTVVVTPDREPSFRTHLDELHEGIRQRAFDLYCRRTRRQAEKADWLQAEHEAFLSPLTSIEENGREFRITAACPKIDANHLTVEVLPDSILVEGTPCGSETKRFSVFHVNRPINPAAVKAEFINGELVIVAPKA